MENLTEIKSRLIQFAKEKGFTREEFYKKIGIDGANFRGKNASSELGSDKIVSILQVFPELNSDWLLLGKGEMLRSEETKQVLSTTESDKIWKEILADKDRRIEELIIENYQIREQIAHIQAITPPLRSGLTKMELQDCNSEQSGTFVSPTPETLLTYSHQQLVSLAISQQETIASMSETIDRLTSKQ